MSKHVTIYDVAERAGISVASVSYALNGRTRMISEATNRRVHRLAREMGYRPSRQARHLRGRSSMTLAVQVDSSITSSNSWRSTMALNLIMLEGVSTFAATHGYHVHLLISRHEHPLEEVQQQILQENSFDGIIFTGYRSLVPQDAAKLVRRMKTGGVTAVTIDETLGAAGLPMVAVNLEPAVLQAVQRLKALHCRRAAYIGLMHQVAHERIARFDLFRNALEQAGIDLPERSILRTHREIDGYRHTLELLRRGPLPDCIVYGSDHIAMAGLEALRDNGIRAPDEVRVMGVDHAPYAAESPVELASLDQRYFDRGRTLAKVLLDQINHPKKGVPSRTELDARFVDGASLGAAGRTGSMQPRLERSLETC